MPVELTPFKTLVVDTNIMASGDALGAKSSFANIPRRGTIMSVVVADNAKQSVNLDIYLFSADIAGTATNAAFDPTDAELLTCVGVILVDTWKANNDNSIGSIDNVGLPYYAPGGVLYFQCVTRGTPTYAAVDDVSIRLGILA